MSLALVHIWGHISGPTRGAPIFSRECGSIHSQKVPGTSFSCLVMIDLIQNTVTHILQVDLYTLCLHHCIQYPIPTARFHSIDVSHQSFCYQIPYQSEKILLDNIIIIKLCFLVLHLYSSWNFLHKISKM